VLKGTITSVLDDGETDLRAGDILVQRGTNHAWENRADEMCRICFVLIDGQ
jgi:quercetin dioxygenase-like cupin family protein